MKRWIWLLLVALAASPAVADDKKKDDKKAKGAPAAQAPVVQDAVKEAEAKLAAGDADGALTVLDKAMATDPKAALRLGQLREKRGELDLAVDAYKSAGERLDGPAKGEALGRLAVVQGERGMKDAAASAEAAMAADPEGVWPTIALSHRRADEGKGDEGIALAQKAAAAGGGAAATAALAHAQGAKGDMAAAEASYRQAMATDPTDLGTTVGLATVLRKTGRAAEAEPMLKKAIDGSPGAVEAYKELARVKIALGRAQDALADANLAAAMAENDTEAQGLVLEAKVARALQDLGAGQTDLAIQDLTQLRDQNPASPAVRLGLGRAQIARRDADAALPELQKAVELDPKNAEAQYQLGYVYHVMKQNAAAAVGPYEKAVAGEPGNTLFRTSLGSALTDAGQLDRAVEELTKVTASEGYSGWQAWFSLGAAQLKASRYKEAAAALDKAVAAKPDNAQAEALLAWSYFGLKDAEGFKAHGAKARKLGYKDPQLFDRLTKVEAGQPIK
ncbi:MAG TPA: tetratricopeptide repeat protein [Vicinamibacteria bacterium]|nr:tetratricopeptide repeat protein [Vicinamibacteria bacterium]